MRSEYPFLSSLAASLVIGIGPGIGPGCGNEDSTDPDPVVLVSSGPWSNCLLRASGNTECWGRDWSDAESGPSGRFFQVAVGASFGCGRTRESLVSCWGTEAISFEDVVSDISVGAWEACVVGPGGLVRCTGCSEATGAEWICDPPAERFESLSVGGGFGAGLLRDGRFLVWMNPDDPLVDPQSPSFDLQDELVACTPQMGVVCSASADQDAVSAGYEHWCALRNGTARCWGDPLGGKTDAPDEELVALAAGTEHTCGIRPDGSVVCWGCGQADKGTFDWGQCDVPPDLRAVQISASTYQTCAVTTEGTVECWGCDNPPGDYGQCEGRE